MASREVAPDMGILNPADVKALHKEALRSLSRENGGEGSINSVATYVILSAIDPILRHRLFGSASLQQVAFGDVQYDIERGLHGNALLLGDDQLEAAPKKYAEKLLEEVRRGGDFESLSDTKVGKLTQYVLYHLQREQLPGESAWQYYGDWLGSAISNYRRRQQRQVISESELDELYDKQGREYDVYLTLQRTDLRTDIFLGLRRQITCLQSLSPGVFERTWGEGEINVPREILSDAGIGPWEVSGDVLGSPTVLEWKNDTMADKVRALKQHMQLLDKKYMPGTKSSKCFLARETKAVLRLAMNKKGR